MNTKFLVTVLADHGLALTYGVVVNPRHEVEIEIDLNELSESDRTLIGAALEPGGSRLYAVVRDDCYNHHRIPSVRLRAWPFTAAGIIRALERFIDEQAA